MAIEGLRSFARSWLPDAFHRPETQILSFQLMII